MNSTNKILAILPDILRNTGDAINERQLLRHLCRIHYCVVISFIPLARLMNSRSLINKLYEDDKLKNIRLVLVPIPYLRVFVLMISIVITPFIWVLDKLIRFHIIYIRDSIWAYGPLSLKSLARKICVKIPYILDDEILKGRRFISIIYTLTDRFVLSKAKVVGVPSILLLKKLTTKRRVIWNGNIVLIPPGIDSKKIEVILKTYRLPKQNNYIVGFVGSLVWWQGVDILIKAIAKIKGALDKHVKLLLVGDGPEKKRIEALCNELKIDCHITGFVKHEEALKLLKSLDVLVVPRRRITNTETIIPIKIIEAWALGVPVIATAHEIFKYMNLRDKEDIIFCEPDPEDVADKILLILKHEEIRSMLSKRGTQLAKKYYYDAIAMHIIKVVENNDPNY
jgi:glycosyltransferase involved in cell wall biosynthesis